MKKKTVAQRKQRLHNEREALLDKMAKHVWETVADIPASCEHPYCGGVSDISPDEARTMVRDLMDMMEKSHGKD